MIRELSIFTGSTDIELALGLLHRTATGSAHNAEPLPLSQLASALASEQGHARLRSLATDLDIDPDALPTAEEANSLFQDELLSARALKLHRGRNVYSACKARLWERLWLPFRDQLTVDDATLALMSRLVGMHTQDGGADVESCVALLVQELDGLGFTTERIDRAGHPPLLVARRAARGLPGQVAMYGHYDVATPDRDRWLTDPWTVTEVNGRLFGVGIGDNKAALAHRLILLRDIEHTPELAWIIQGEEEIGSPLAHEVLPGIVAGLEPDVWLEENGYFDLDGTQRMLARTLGSGRNESAPPDAALWTLLADLEHESKRFRLDTRVECRGMNKSFFPTGCPFNNAIPEGGRYVAIGVNDPASRIHQPNESVAMWTFPIHARQFRAVMRWVGQYAEVTK